MPAHLITLRRAQCYPCTAPTEQIHGAAAGHTAATRLCKSHTAITPGEVRGYKAAKPTTQPKPQPQPPTTRLCKSHTAITPGEVRGQSPRAKSGANHPGRSPGLQGGKAGNTAL